MCCLIVLTLRRRTDEDHAAAKRAFPSMLLDVSWFQVPMMSDKENMELVLWPFMLPDIFAPTSV